MTSHRIDSEKNRIVEDIVGVVDVVGVVGIVAWREEKKEARSSNSVNTEWEDQQCSQSLRLDDFGGRIGGKDADG